MQFVRSGRIAITRENANGNFNQIITRIIRHKKWQIILMDFH